MAIGTLLWSYEVFGQVMAPPDQGMGNVGSMETGIGTDGANSGNGAPANAVRFQANDSLIVRLLNGRKAFLFGTAKITHSTGTLLAGKINMNLDSTTVEARGSSLQDSLTMPVLTMGEDEIKSNRILFNYKTEKGKFEDAQVNVSDGLLIGAKIKNVNKSEVFIQDGIYSTCPPDYLYYYLEAKQMKVVDEEEIFFTNARLYVLDIPYPFVLPFGYVPAQMDKKRSGLLTPTYVFDAQASKGIGLHNLGWFQYINDYVTTTLSADVFTSGTYYANNSTQYRLADRFSGAITLGYSRDQGLEPTDPDFSTQINKSIGIRHQQTISPYASISANVNLRTADFFSQNSFNIEDRAQTSSTSRIAYNYRDPEGLFSFSTNASMVQNFFTNSTSLDGPGFTFSTKTLSPFKSTGSSSNAKWYESITLRYNNNFDSNFDYRPIDADTASIGFIDAFLSPSQYREATGTNDYIQLGLKQSANLTVGKIIDSPYINSSVGVQLNEYWYPSSINKRFDPEINQVVTDKVNGFVAGRDFSSSLSLSTTLYGTSTKKIGSFEGLRHTLRPSISFGYRPDFSEPKWGYFREVVSDTLGNTQRYSIFDNEIYRGPSAGEQRAMSLSIQNILETKRVRRDTTGEVSEKKLKIIDNLSLNTSYNFAADSLQLSPLSASLSSSSLKGIRINMRANFSFYQRDSLGRYFDRFLINGSNKLAQMESFRFTASTSFRGGGGGIEPITPKYRRNYDPFRQGYFNPVDAAFGEEPVIPFNSPWSFSLNFSYSWRYRHNDDPLKSATLNAQSISFNLTPKWRFGTTLGYDFIQKELTPSQFSLNRNLECWDLSFQISPFGDYQYYFFRLSVNNAQIQSLFQKLPVLKNLERSSSPNGRSGRGSSTGFPGGTSF
jgi:hypothetical protein